MPSSLIPIECVNGIQILVGRYELVVHDLYVKYTCILLLYFSSDADDVDKLVCLGNVIIPIHSQINLLRKLLIVNLLF